VGLVDEDDLVGLRDGLCTADMLATGAAALAAML
jgi:hypothetical protein